MSLTNTRSMLQRVIIAAIIIGVLLPFVPLIIWSFSRRWYFPALLPTAWSLRAWRYIFSPASQVPRAVGHSTFVALAVTSLSLIVGIPAGRALGLRHFRGKTVVEFLILAPTIVPPLAVAMGIHVAFIKYGLANTIWGVILVHLIPVTPYAVMIFSGIFANYNLEFEEQAHTLGAGRTQVFLYVTLPAILPGVVVGGLFAFVISWSQYLLTLLIGGGRVVTLPLLLFSFANSGDYAITAALSLIFIAPAVLFLFVSSRYLTGENVAVGLGNFRG